MSLYVLYYNSLVGCQAKRNMNCVFVVFYDELTEILERIRIFPYLHLVYSLCLKSLTTAGFLYNNEELGEKFFA